MCLSNPRVARTALVGIFDRGPHLLDQLLLVVFRDPFPLDQLHEKAGLEALRANQQNTANLRML